MKPLKKATAKKGSATKKARPKRASAKTQKAKPVKSKTAKKMAPAKVKAKKVVIKPKAKVVKKKAVTKKVAPKKIGTKDPIEAKALAQSKAAAARVAKSKAAVAKAKAVAVKSKPAEGKIEAKPKDPPRKPTPPAASKKIQAIQAERDRRKNLSAGSLNGHSMILLGDANGAPGNTTIKKDRIVLLVRDAFWLQCVWELMRQSVERAQVALGQHWHTAKPVIRVIAVDTGSTTSAVEQVDRVIPIHGGVNTWYIDVKDAPKSFRVDIGYLAANEKFFSLARSNSVTTPRPGTGDALENNWSEIADDCEKIYALSGGFSDETATELQEVFEERMGRPMNGPAGTRYGVGAEKLFQRRSDFNFEVDAEMIIFGSTRPNARVSLAGNPVKLRADGTFAARLAMPDRRQVLPIVASSADGVEQRTVVIAVERNTKFLEPILKEVTE